MISTQVYIPRSVDSVSGAPSWTLDMFISSTDIVLIITMKSTIAYKTVPKQDKINSIQLNLTQIEVCVCVCMQTCELNK